MPARSATSPTRFSKRPRGVLSRVDRISIAEGLDLSQQCQHVVQQTCHCQRVRGRCRGPRPRGDVRKEIFRLGVKRIGRKGQPVFRAPEKILLKESLHGGAA